MSYCQLFGDFFLQQAIMSNSVGNSLYYRFLSAMKPIVYGKRVILTGSAENSPAASAFIQRAGAIATHSAKIPVAMSDIASQLYWTNRFLATPSIEFMSKLDRIDPHREAIVFAGSYVYERSVAGRRIVGARSYSTAMSERKHYQLKLLSAQGSKQVYLTGLNLNELTNQLYQWVCESSCVISGDPIDHLPMGSSHVYYLPENTSSTVLRNLMQDLLPNCSGFRLAAATLGLPVTYYGFMAGDRSVLFGPVEALVGYNLDTLRIQASGIQYPVILDPQKANSAKAAISRLAASFASKTGYVGAFGVDGSLVDGNLVIHELNPRVCAGFSWLQKYTDPRLQLGIVDLILRESSPEVNTELLDCLESMFDVIKPPRSSWLWENTKGTHSKEPATILDWLDRNRTATLIGHKSLYRG